MQPRGDTGKETRQSCTNHQWFYLILFPSKCTDCSALPLYAFHISFGSVSSSVRMEKLGIPMQFAFFWEVEWETQMTLISLIFYT